LESNGLYHNDTHSENVDFIINAIVKIALIDFGKATLGKPTMATTTGIPRKTQNNNNKELSNVEIITLMVAWINGNKKDNDPFIERYGGKNKRTKKSRKQKKRIPIKKRKTRKSPI